MVSILEKAKLGHILVWLGYLKPGDLADALIIQSKYPNFIGETLICQGFISRQQLQEALQIQEHIPYINLTEHQSSVFIEHDGNRWDYMRKGCIPWKKSMREITIATYRVTPDIENWAKLCFRTYETIRFVLAKPQDIYESLRMNYAKADTDYALSHLRNQHPEFSYYTLYFPLKPWLMHHGMTSLMVGMASIVFFLLFPLGFFYMVMILVCSVYYGMMGTKLGLMLKRPLKHPKRLTDSSSITHTNQSSSPQPLTISLIIPLLNEAQIIPQLLHNLSRIDLPQSRLQILITVEAHDVDTISALNCHFLPPYIWILYVPPSHPQTKGKACNFALQYVIHDIVGILDGDDLIHPLQLKYILAQFQSEPDTTAAIQSRLNYYNSQENWLTHMFSLEYTLWFDYMLPGLLAYKAPLPLGGSSNFFRTCRLREIGGWDPYNVTEDADIGIRLARLGLHTKLSPTLTLEEAPSTLSAWISQRTRWIKGHIQTYLVHMHSPFDTLKDLGLKRFIWFNLFIGLPCLGHLLSPLIWLVGLLYPLMAMGLGLPNIPYGLKWIATSTLLIGMGLHAFMAWYAKPPSTLRDYLALLTFPAYWFLHAIAAMLAVIELAQKPFFWNKTMHKGRKVM